MAVGPTHFSALSQSAPQSIIIRARPRLTRSALWRRWRRDLTSISPRVPRNVSSIFAVLGLAASARSSSFLDGDLLLFLLRLGRLGQGHREHTVLERRRDLVGVNAFGHLERALERPEAALR